MESPYPIFSQASFFKGSRNVSFHSHPGCELILITHGACRIDTPDQSFSAAKDDLMIISPETAHNQLCDASVETLFVVFNMDPQFFNQQTRLLHMQNNPWCLKLMRTIVSLSTERHYDLCDGIIYSLLKYIKNVEEESVHQGATHPALLRAMAKINASYGEDLDINALASTAHVSPSYLRALFMSQLGLSPMQYLQNIRMARARELLNNPYWNVAEIAQRCGYRDANYFARLFRKIHHETPTRYREIITTRDPEASIRL